MNELVKLNVGGQRFVTTLSTLRGEQVAALRQSYLSDDKHRRHSRGASSDDSKAKTKSKVKVKKKTKSSQTATNMLVRLIENDKSGRVPSLRDEEGYIFIDRSSRLFQRVLEFLQTGRLPSDKHRRDVIAELDYFQIARPNLERFGHRRLPSSSSSPSSSASSVGSSSSFASSSSLSAINRAVGNAPLTPDVLRARGAVSNRRRAHSFGSPTRALELDTLQSISSATIGTSDSDVDVSAASMHPLSADASFSNDASFEELMQIVCGQLDDWHGQAQTFFEVNASAIARKMVKATQYGSTSVTVVSFTSGYSGSFSCTDVGTSFHLEQLPCQLFLQNLAKIIESLTNFRTVATSTDDPSGFSRRHIVVHFPIVGNADTSSYSRKDDALDKFLDMVATAPSVPGSRSASALRVLSP
jgi:BTB/POZ domain